MPRLASASPALLSLALFVACGDKAQESAANTSASAIASPSIANAAQAEAAPGRTSTDPRVQRADLARIKGSDAAKVWVVIVSDFECPYCKMWHDSPARTTVNEYVQGGKVRVAYVNYPLRQHRHAVPMAEAAMCAGAQGKFWEMHDALFATQERWTPMPDASALVDSLGTAIALDMAAQRSCLADDVMLPMIQADYDRGIAANVRSTPSFVIGSETLSGVESPDAFRRAIDKALAAAAK